MSDLRPGVKALTLPHPACTPGWAYQEVEVLTAPISGIVWTVDGAAHMRVCMINGNLTPPLEEDGYKPCWPASHLIPIPDDKLSKLPVRV